VSWRTCCLYSPKSVICKMVINASRNLYKGISCHQVHDCSAIHSFTRPSRTETLSWSEDRVHYEKSVMVVVFPWNRFKSKCDLSIWSLSPHSCFSPNILCLSSIPVLTFRHRQNFTKSFFCNRHKLLMALHIICYDQALLRSNILHDEVLQHSLIDVVNVALKS